jgi:hypothetical protein
MDELNKQIDLMLEHSLGEETFLDERSSPQQKKFNSFVQNRITPIRRKIEADVGRNEIERLIGLRRNDAGKFKGAFKAKALDYVEEMEELLRAREAGTAPSTTPATPTPTPPTTTPSTTTPERPPLTPEERDEARAIAAQAAYILAMAAFESSSPTSMVPKFARILKKYFISYRVPKQRSIAEELESLSEETAPAPTTSSSGRPPPDTSSASADRATDALLMDLFDEESVHPDVSRVTLEKLRARYRDALIRLNDYAASSSIIAQRKFARVKGLRNLILQAADRGMMQEGKDKQLIIDLNKVKENHLDEGMLRMFGAWIEYFLNGLFGGWMPPVSVRGSQKDVEAFAHALAGEKKYIETAKRYGLNHPTTYKNKAKLGNAVKGFEKETGIKWPFK